MLRNTVVDRYNVNLIDYNVIFAEQVSRVVVNELYDLNMLIDDQLPFDKTCRRAITHHVIRTVCECILEVNEENAVPVLCCCINCINKTELNKYITDKNLGDFVDKLFAQLSNMLGIKYIMHDKGYDQLLVDVARRDGDLIEQLYEISRNKKPRDLIQMKKYVKKHGLVNIEEQFFESQRLKQVLI